MSLRIPMEDDNPFLKRYAHIIHPRSKTQVGLSLQDMRDIFWHSFSSKVHGLDKLEEPQYGTHPISDAPWYMATPIQHPNEKFCRFCSHINFERFLQNGIIVPDGVILLYEEMIANASTCNFCHFTITALCHHKKRLRERDVYRDSVIIVYLYGHRDNRIMVGECALFGATDKSPTREVICQDTRAFWKHLPLQQINEGNGTSLGRRINPFLVDTALMKNWIKNCEGNHKDQFDATEWIPDSKQDFFYLADSKQKLHVIDLRERRICVPECGTRYITLSYVWGGIKQLLLTMFNYDELTTQGSLDSTKYKARIPRTIRDAMRFAERLGERFLWVDALCLVQDGPEFSEEILTMDRIYSEAAWCLVSAATEDADTPLPRMGNKGEIQQEHQYVVTIRGMTLGVVLPPLKTYLLSVEWETRAWSVP